MVAITRMRRISLIVMMVFGGASTSCHPDDRSTADTRVAQLTSRPGRYVHLPAIQQAIIGFLLIYTADGYPFVFERAMP